MRRAPRSRAEQGFSLIELLAVTLIFGLIAGIALPNLGLRTRRVLQDQATRLAADLEYVRLQAVMTGAPHRIVFDLEGMSYWLESYSAGPAGAAPAEPEVDPRTGAPPLLLAAPRGAQTSFRRLLGLQGDRQRLDELVFFDGIETPDGYFDRGELDMVFESDGTTDASWIVLADDAGRAITLQVEPLADTVRFEHGRL